MATLSTQAPDGSTLQVQVPPGTEPSGYDALAEDAVAHYTASRQSPAESAARGALRNFPLAQQAAAAVAPVNPFSEKKTYGDELAHLTQAAEEGKQQHPVAYGAGAVAGTLAPLAVPGAGEALEAAPILGNAALGAAQSLSDANLTRPTSRDLGQAAVGAGIGGAFGAVSQGLRAVAPDAETLAANSTAHGFGATARNIGKVMGDDPNASLQALGEWANAVTTPEGEPLVGLAQRPAQMLRALNSIHDAAGDQIGDILDKVAPKASLPKGSLTAELYPLADELDTIMPDQQAKVLGVIGKINKLADAGKLDLPALNKIKSLVGEQVSDNPVMARVYGSLSESVNRVLDEYGRVVGDPAERVAYETAKENYRNASRLLPLLRRAEGRELAQGPAGNGGLLGLFGLASGVASGHPAAGALAMPVNAVARPIGNLVGRNAALRAVPYMPAIAAGSRKLNQATALELANYLQSQFGKKEP